MHILLGVDNQKMRILKRLILMLLLSDSVLFVNAQNHINNIVANGKTYTLHNGYLYKDERSGEYFKIGNYFVPGRVIGQPNSQFKKMKLNGITSYASYGHFEPYQLITTLRDSITGKYYQHKMSFDTGLDTIRLIVGAAPSKAILWFEKPTIYKDENRIYYLYEISTKVETIEDTIRLCKQIPEMSWNDLTNTTRPCVMLDNSNRRFPYCIDYKSIPDYVFIHAKRLNVNQVQYTPFFVRFTINGKVWKISTYDWNLLHEEKLPVFRFRTFALNNLWDVAFSDKAICFRVGLTRDLYFFKDVASLLKENGYPVNKQTKEDFVEYFNVLPLRKTELRPVGEIAEYYNDFVSSGRSCIVYK